MSRTPLTPARLPRLLASGLSSGDGGSARARWLAASPEEERAAARETAAPLSGQGRRQRCWAGPGSGLVQLLQGLCESRWGCEVLGPAERPCALSRPPRPPRCSLGVTLRRGPQHDRATTEGCPRGRTSGGQGRGIVECGGARRQPRPLTFVAALGHQAWAAHWVGGRPLLVGTAACRRREQRVSSGGSLLSLGLYDVETEHPTDLVWGPESAM